MPVSTEKEMALECKGNKNLKNRFPYDWIEYIMIVKQIINLRWESFK